ncbi:MAG: hypothetical protein ACOCZB_04240 [Spirochaetota bacterium]
MADDGMIREQAQTAIRDDPAISDPTRVIVSVTKEGPIFRKKEVVTLEGRVKSPIEVKKAEAAVQRKLPTTPIKNNLSPE